MQYRIFEGNMERLEKKLDRIANKCKKYGNSFHYEVVGEEYVEKKDKNGIVYTVRYVIVEAEGTAIINDWKFIASVEHTKQGNIIKNCCEIEVPERYYTSEPICEHCNSNRVRKYTYIVQNIKTSEFKQVGKSCLMDFTGGMDAAEITRYISLFDALIQGEIIEPGHRAKHYIRTKEALQYVAETIRHFGYVKSNENQSTKLRAINFYMVENKMLHGRAVEEIKETMKEISFNENSEDIINLVENVLCWIKRQDESNNYFHNLKTVCALDYVDFDKFGILASVFPAYEKAIERERQIAEEKENGRQSVYVGNVGDRITIIIANYRMVTSWQTAYGLTMIYKITDTSGNIYTWKTGNTIDDKAVKITGTVKAHSEFNGAKQTEITRCRVA